MLSQQDMNDEYVFEPIYVNAEADNRIFHAKMM